MTINEIKRMKLESLKVECCTTILQCIMLQIEDNSFNPYPLINSCYTEIMHLERYIQTTYN